MEISMKILCIIAILICIGFCYYIYRINTKKIEIIEDCSNDINREVGRRLVPIEKYDIKVDSKKKYPYFEIFAGDKYLGKIEFELIDDVVPKTCKNFRFLCSNSFSEKSNKPMYQNTEIDIIYKDNFIIGGSSINYSIYGNVFEDENFELKHNQPGMLAMYNDGKNKNNSKFIITLKKLPKFDNKYVVFGIIRSGYEVIDELNKIETDDKYKPNIKCKIAKCGLME